MQEASNNAILLDTREMLQVKSTQKLKQQQHAKKNENLHTPRNVYAVLTATKKELQ